jgi:hypothetical protein
MPRSDSPGHFYFRINDRSVLQVVPFMFWKSAQEPGRFSEQSDRIRVFNLLLSLRIFNKFGVSAPSGQYQWSQWARVAWCSA